MMEPLTRRIALHIYTEKQDKVVAFYRDLLGMRVAKDIVLLDGERWIALVKPDNIGVQFHVHTKTSRNSFYPFRVELSIGCGAYESTKRRIQDAGHSIKEFDLPYCAGFDFTDPIGNEITLSWWGELEHDEMEGWDTEFLDYENCTIPIKDDRNNP